MDSSNRSIISTAATAGTSFNDGSTDDVLIADVQGFHTPGGFTAKEIAFFDGTRIAHYLFAPPCPFKYLTGPQKRAALWLQNNYHGISWNFGHVPQERLSSIIEEITQGHKTIMVKGIEKVRFFYSFLNSDQDVINIEDIAPCIPSIHLIKDKPHCMNHKLSDCHCALSNVKVLYDWLRRNNLIF